MTGAGGTAPARLTAWILSYTGVSDEPRVLRQAKALSDAGWCVVVAGHDGRSPRPPEWQYIRLDDTIPSRSLPKRIWQLGERELGRSACIHLAGWPAIAQAGARLIYRGLPLWSAAQSEILAAAERTDLRPDLVIAHDYHTCPPAAELARHSGAAFVVDCHEYARDEYPGNPRWMARERPFVVALQDDYLARADAVTTVSDGIARLLDRDQRLKRPAITVRSLPFFREMPLRPVGEMIEVLYHGIVGPERGLEVSIQSVRDWRPDYRLTIRGNGESAYVDALKALSHEAGVGGRVRFEPAVPFGEIIPAANQADIGLFVQSDLSPQKRLALPNKFFEYVMAGLALCIADLPEMAALLQRHDLGVLARHLRPDAVAEAVNSLSRDRIMHYKAQALAAARVLNWESEQRIMIALFDELMRERGSSAC
ncbi:glycosyltransferase [Bosea vestrisii]|uniref:glycosyltransferase n=1 Tax=Bosea vestrisii TaxID=151416 RepID=UPI0024DFF2AC|nr:glycosyltransferase [Bosea vestrisii]WID98761.1 glycosyltransferase [Bosea vestrisii]